MKNPISLNLETVNRSVIVVRMKQPYVDWANKLPDRNELEVKYPQTVELMNEDAEAYLVPEIFDQDEWDAYLETRWPILFDELLMGWTSDATLWPKRRSLKLLKEWFDITIHSLVKDFPNRDPIGYAEY